jgi:hypothetical protein
MSIIPSDNDGVHDEKEDVDEAEDIMLEEWDEEEDDIIIEDED